MKEGKWKDKEVVQLFREVENAKENNKCVKIAFLHHANKFSRKASSVRNYYYHEVDNLLENELRAKKLGIDLNKHRKQSIKYFSENESEEILNSIEDLVKEGKSVRQACLELSGGNIALMLRYQNKYRNSQKQEKEKPNNILEFRAKQNSLSENEINSLFLGLVKLIKKNAVEEVSENLRKEKQAISILLKKTLIEVSEKEQEIAVLKDKVLKLEIENKKMELMKSNKMDMAKVLVDKLTKIKEENKELLK